MPESAAPIPPPLPDLALTYGVFEVGALMVMFLTGIATLQVWNYFRDYDDDPKSVRLMVIFVYGADVLHTALLCHSLYHYTIIKFGQFLDLQTIVWSLEATIPMAGVVAFVVQTYFCVRIQRITGWIAAGVCWILALARLILDCFLTQEVAGAGVFVILQAKRAKTLGLGTLIVGAVSDVLIAGFMCMGLLRARSGFARTDKLLDKLVAYTIGSGLLTSIVALCEAVTFGVLSNFVFLAFYCILPKLFSNSLLASLNERSYTRRDLSNKNYGFGSSQSRSGEQRVTFERTTTVTGPGGVELSTLNESQYKGTFFTEGDKVAVAV